MEGAESFAVYATHLNVCVLGVAESVLEHVDDVVCFTYFLDEFLAVAHLRFLFTGGWRLVWWFSSRCRSHVVGRRSRIGLEDCLSWLA